MQGKERMDGRALRLTWSLLMIDTPWRYPKREVRNLKDRGRSETRRVTSIFQTRRKGAGSDPLYPRTLGRGCAPDALKLTVNSPGEEGGGINMKRNKPTGYREACFIADAEPEWSWGLEFKLGCILGHIGSNRLRTWSGKKAGKKCPAKHALLRGHFALEGSHDQERRKRGLVDTPLLRQQNGGWWRWSNDDTAMGTKENSAPEP